jgi:hypothetical protein
VTFPLETPVEAITTLDPCASGSVCETETLPSHAMEDQFHPYLAWTEAVDLDVTYAFQGSGKHRAFRPLTIPRALSTQSAHWAIQRECTQPTHERTPLDSPAP